MFRKKSGGLCLLILVGFLLFMPQAGCKWGKVRELPKEKPEEIIKRFYNLIVEGSPSSIHEAYKLISAEKSKLSEQRFRQIVESYPPGFRVDVKKTEIKDDHAKVDIEFMVPSKFEKGGVKMHTTVPLTVDEKAHVWKIDFTGESDKQTKASAKGR